MCIKWHRDSAYFQNPNNWRGRWWRRNKNWSRQQVETLFKTSWFHPSTHDHWHVGAFTRLCIIETTQYRCTKLGCLEQVNGSYIIALIGWNDTLKYYAPSHACDIRRIPLWIQHRSRKRWWMHAFETTQVSSQGHFQSQNSYEQQLVFSSDQPAEESS